MTPPLFTVVIPTLGRPTLPHTLASINPAFAETIVVADAFDMVPDRLNEIANVVRAFHARFEAVDAGRHNHGSPQLQHGYAIARGRWILNLGDDDRFEPYAFQTMASILETMPIPTPAMFRVVLHPAPQRGAQRLPVVLWAEPIIRRSWMTGQSFVIPNRPDRMGSWLHDQDVGFIETTLELWHDRVEWRPEVIEQCY